MPDPLNPFTPEQLADVDAAIASADQALAGIDKAKRAGIEIEGQREMVVQQREQLMRIKRTYAPGR